MNWQGLPDAEIIARLKKTSGWTFEEGFRELVRRYKDALVSYLVRYVGDHATAEDLAQQAFVRVFRHVGDFNSSAKFSTWIYTIASNLAKDEFKRRSRHPAVSFDWNAAAEDPEPGFAPAVTRPQPGPADAAASRDVAETVQRLLQTLDPEDREALTLRDLQGMSYEDMAQVLGMPVGTAKSRVARARQAFKALWEARKR